VAAVVFAARKTRRYVLIVCATQEQANDHVGNIAAILESPVFEFHYPATARRKIGKYGQSRAWRQDRLRTEDGFTVHAIGLDTAARGAKIEDVRPDCIICDDLDELLDSPLTTQKKIETLTKSVLPAAGDRPAIMFLQNLILSNGIAARLVDGRADFLTDAFVSGPYPAIQDLTYETVEGKAVITGGTPTWEARSLSDYQNEINNIGISAFLAEFQHEVQNLSRGIFAKVDFRHIRYEDIPELREVQVWCDPAVSDTDNSDSHGVQCDGIGTDRKLYRLYSWEGRTSPEDSISRAILVARFFGATCVGIETDQGGDTWYSVYSQAWKKLVTAGLIPPEEKMLPMRSAKAGARGPKMHRGSKMLAGYERAEILHATGKQPINGILAGMSIGDHDRSSATLERALRRFGIEKPFDLADAAYWSWHGLSFKTVVRIA
jgi:hypothetical protein